jgi:hypothetical protein
LSEDTVISRDKILGKLEVLPSFPFLLYLSTIPERIGATPIYKKGDGGLWSRAFRAISTGLLEAALETRTRVINSP